MSEQEESPIPDPPTTGEEMLLPGEEAQPRELPAELNDPESEGGEGNATSELRVRLPVFEGPLDLLLYLIKKDEVDIYDIPIERITKQYQQYLEMMKMLDLDIAGEFLVVAATLLYIKSRTLLPKDQQLPEEEAEEDDPRWELIRQLVEYKKYKDAAWQLHLRRNDQEKLFERGQAVEADGLAEMEPMLGEFSVFDLITAFQKVLDRANEKEDLREIFEDRWTVGDKIQYLREFMGKRQRVFFQDLFAEAASRTEIVVTFLAMLELIRQKELRVLQSDAFGEIEIAKAAATDGDPPRPAAE